MEIVLLLVLIALLFVIKNSFNSKFDALQSRFDALNKKIDFLKNGDFPVDVKKDVEKVAITLASNSAKPVPIVEETKPPVVIAATEPIFEKKEEETIVFSMDSYSDIKPEPKKPYVPVGSYTGTPADKRPYVVAPREKSFVEKFRDKNPDLETFIGENLISKIGILILVLGISYFVKFAIDKDWINEPARVGIGVLCGALVMGIAHKLREKYAAFSSVLVAGAIAIFYFTIGIAFHEYHLFNQTVAFSIMVVITAFSCLVSLSYNRVELAVLSLIGGFAVPFMVSTGSGNYVVLFSYILILNTGILAIAYHKKWNLVNLLSFIFTVILYGGWLVTDLSSAKHHYLGGFWFGFAFYTLFTIINFIHNVRTKGQFTTTQLSIFIANTFLFYGAGMAILNTYHPELKGAFTGSIAGLNLFYAWFLYKKFGLDKNAIYLLIGLTLTFITLAIPVQFQGNYITLFWAGEAVLLMWLAQKSKISSYRFGSVIVHLLMTISLLMDWDKYYSNSSLVLNIALNPIFITGVVAFTSLFLVYFLLKKEEEPVKLAGIIFNPSGYREFIFIIGIIVAYVVGIAEVAYQADDYIKEYESVASVPIVYHLLFSAILFHFALQRKTKSAYSIASIIAMLNVFIFAFLFSKVPFSEHRAYITTAVIQRIAFYLHYISLGIIVYFLYQLYKMHREKIIGDFLNQKLFIWVFAFFILFIASSEVMLHGLLLGNSPITTSDIVAYNKTVGITNFDIKDNYTREIIANEKIDSLRTTIWKTSFPVLWGIFAFVFLIFGIKRQNKTLRIIALSLLGLTIVKLFLFDISNVSETGKIIAFILLGILVLVISFVYQKIKVLVTDDKKPDDDAMRTIDTIYDENKTNTTDENI
jgi:uncharacterized membrane protein